MEWRDRQTICICFYCLATSWEMRSAVATAFLWRKCEHIIDQINCKIMKTLCESHYLPEDSTINMQYNTSLSKSWHSRITKKYRDDLVCKMLVMDAEWLLLEKDHISFYLQVEIHTNGNWTRSNVRLESTQPKEHGAESGEGNLYPVRFICKYL